MGNNPERFREQGTVIPTPKEQRHNFLLLFFRYVIGIPVDNLKQANSEIFVKGTSEREAWIGIYYSRKNRGKDGFDEPDLTCICKLCLEDLLPKGHEGSREKRLGITLGLIVQRLYEFNRDNSSEGKLTLDLISEPEDYEVVQISLHETFCRASELKERKVQVLTELGVEFPLSGVSCMDRLVNNLGISYLKRFQGELICRIDLSSLRLISQGKCGGGKFLRIPLSRGFSAQSSIALRCGQTELSTTLTRGELILNSRVR